MDLRQAWRRFGWLGLLSLAAAGPRVTTPLNDGWRFRAGGGGGGPLTPLEAVTLPHTWNNKDGQDGGNNYRRDVGTYTRTLPFDPAWAGRRVYLRVGAANIDAYVYVNDKLAGSHKGGFAAFCYDVTDLLHPGDNDLEIIVDNRRDPDVAPLSADFTFFGGLYRGVQLIVADPLSVSLTDDGAGGVYVRQDAVSADEARLTVTAVVHNAGKADRMAKLGWNVAGVAGDSPVTRVPAGASVTVEQHVTVPHPHLWDGRRDPYEYPVSVAVSDGDRTTDSVQDRIGLRSYHVDPEHGFTLNGHPQRLYGVNRHQDRLDQGWAVSADDEAGDAQDIVDLGCTAVRLSHYQQSPHFYDLMDAAGIVVWAEIPLVNDITDSPAFGDNAEQQLRELVKQNYNHPSICFWGLFNELHGGKSEPQQVALVTRLNAAAHRLDPSRLTTAASNQSVKDPLAMIADVGAYNRYTGWYSGRLDGWPKRIDEIHAAHPDRPFAISEYGAGAAVTQHEPFPIRQPKTLSPWHPEEYQAECHERAWAAIAERPWVWGAFVWCLHDFASDGRNEGDAPGRNDKGLVTYDGRTRKDAFYFYQANWSERPMVYVADRRFTPRPASDAGGPLKVYSNCDQVSVTVNGQAVAPARPNGVHVYWWPSVGLRPGENRIEAVGVRGGQRVADAVTITVEGSQK